MSRFFSKQKINFKLTFCIICIMLFCFVKLIFLERMEFKNKCPKESIAAEVTLNLLAEEREPIILYLDTLDGKDMKVIEIIEEEGIPLIEDPVRDGYDFMGWYLEPEYETFVSFTEIEITSSLTIYGKWEATDISYIAEPIESLILQKECEQNIATAYCATGGQIIYEVEGNCYMPQGLAIDNSGQIIGVPEETGEFLIAISAIHENGMTASTTYTLEIEKEKITFPSEEETFFYNGEIQRSALVETVEYSVISNDGGINVGRYGAVLQAKEGYIFYLEYEDEYVETWTHYFNIVPKTLSIIPKNNQTAVYGEEVIILFDAAELEERDEFIGALALDGTGVGEHGFLMGSLSIKDADRENPNYELFLLKDNKVKFTILPKELIIQPKDNQSIFKGQTMPQIAYDVVGLVEGDQSSDILSGFLTREAGSAVGDYKILLGNLHLNTPNYKLKFMGDVLFHIYSIKVYFNTNGGTLIDIIELDYNQAIEVLPNEPSRPGYEFAGWYSDESFTTVFSFATKLVNHQTLYAKWELISVVYYGVDLEDGQYGSLYAENIDYATCETGGSISYSLTSISVLPLGLELKDTKILGVPIKSGQYTFTILAEHENGTSMEATFSLVVQKVHVYVTPLKNQSVIYKEDYEIEYTITGVLFGDPISGSLILENTEIGNPLIKIGSFSLNENYIIIFDDTITFEILSNVLDITLISVDQIIQTITGEYKETLEKPVDPLRKGFSFAGWYKDNTFTEPWNFLTELVLTKTTLYAKWTLENAKSSLLKVSTDEGVKLIVEIANESSEITYTYLWEKFIDGEWIKTEFNTKEIILTEEKGEYRCIVTVSYDEITKYSYSAGLRVNPENNNQTIIILCSSIGGFLVLSGIGLFIYLKRRKKIK